MCWANVSGKATVEEAIDLSNVFPLYWKDQVIKKSGRQIRRQYFDIADVDE
jgi:hypothetical protein